MRNYFHILLKHLFKCVDIVVYDILYLRELLRCQFYSFRQCEGLILWN